MTECTEATIVVCTPLHRYGEDNVRGESGRKDKDYGPLKLYVDIIREVAEYYSIPVIDFYKNALIQPNIEANKLKYTQDGLHPNTLGHVLMAERIGNFLLSY
jgi:lysophospholipase L1-like esterase